MIDSNGAPRPSFPVPRGALDSLFGGDVWAAGFVRDRTPRKTNQHRLRMRLESETRLKNGRDLLQIIRAVLDYRKPRETLAQLKRLDLWFPHTTLRVNEVHDYLDHHRRGFSDEDLDSFLGRAMRPRRGGPNEWSQSLQIVCWLDELIRSKRTRPAAAAAEELKRCHPEVQLPGVARLKNLHSQLQHHARIFAQGYFVPGNALRPQPWGHVAKEWRVYLSPIGDLTSSS